MLELPLGEFQDAVSLLARAADKKSDGMNIVSFHCLGGKGVACAASKSSGHLTAEWAFDSEEFSPFAVDASKLQAAVRAASGDSIEIRPSRSVSFSADYKWKLSSYPPAKLWPRKQSPSSFTLNGGSLLGAIRACSATASTADGGGEITLLSDNGSIFAVSCFAAGGIYREIESVGDVPDFTATAIPVEHARLISCDGDVAVTDIESPNPCFSSGAVSVRTASVRATKDSERFFAGCRNVDMPHVIVSSSGLKESISRAIALAEERIALRFSGNDVVVECRETSECVSAVERNSGDFNEQIAPQFSARFMSQVTRFIDGDTVKVTPVMPPGSTAPFGVNSLVFEMPGSRMAVGAWSK